MTDGTEEPQDAPAVVINAPDQIWLTFGDLSEFAGGNVEYASICRAGDISWCEDQIDKSDVQYVRADLVSQHQAELAAAKEQGRREAIEIIEQYRVPVGNSPAGELARDWTLQALREIRDEIAESARDAQEKT